MVGNGVTDDEFDGNALVPFVHGMGLISDDLFQVSWYSVHTPTKKKLEYFFSNGVFLSFFLSSKLLLIAWANIIIPVVIIVKAPLPRLIE